MIPFFKPKTYYDIIQSLKRKNNYMRIHKEGSKNKGPKEFYYFMPFWWKKTPYVKKVKG